MLGIEDTQIDKWWAYRVYPLSCGEDSQVTKALITG